MLSNCELSPGSHDCGIVEIQDSHFIPAADVSAGVEVQSWLGSNSKPALGQLQPGLKSPALIRLASVPAGVVQDQREDGCAV